ncbi:MAG: hypothetical protein JO203_08670 [Gammaproteobacteria bacterium]|nr:hypothetical protein [Gammaproteobacteria bacterium]
MSIPESRERGQALILLAMWLFFGGGAASALVVYDQPISSMKKTVKRVITDERRKDAVLSAISQWEWTQERANKKVSDARDKLLEALRRKDTPRSALDPLLAQLDQAFLVMDWDFLNLRFRVKDQVTNVEWAEIAAPSRP